MILKILQAGEPALRQPCRPLAIEEIKSQSTQDLIDLMKRTMRDAPGVGLAAPQIGEMIQLAVVEDRPEYVAGLSAEMLAERDRRPIDFHVVINPGVEVTDAVSVDFFEGCLSLSGHTAVVSRARAVRVKCLNEKAEPVVIEARGWHARILQHEVDHLNGTLYVDRMIPRSFMTLDNYLKHWRSRSIPEIKRAMGL